MKQLESLLTGIAPTEREEAIQYYSDYFDDAGAENEQEVIEALGNPARVAENIKRDLLDSGYGKKPAGKAKASDRALMEYGQSEPGGEADTGEEPDAGHAAAAGQGSGKFAAGQEDRAAGEPAGAARDGGGGPGGAQARTESNGAGWNPFEGYGRSAESAPPEEDAYRWSHDTAGWFGEKPEKERKESMPAWAIALLITVLVFGFPVYGGVFMGILGLLLGWFGTMLGLGVGALALLILFLVLVVVGILCLIINPWVGIALVGAGLLVGCFGILLMMLTVAMAGIVTPAIFRGIFGLFGFVKRKCLALAGR
ncbi:hypothetical protein [uncultured Acetatifactor sp.]|uniref:HAAS signaling domain-containing protein n=1 Tax=uncultured Acetatifactor sp. TaxID=1671927 RepID=UPI002639AB47|nr:hypothetical protein [uncultured Acetatifactor sp.]